MAQKSLIRELEKVYEHLSIISPEEIIFAGRSFSVNQPLETSDVPSHRPTTMNLTVELLQNTLYKYTYIQAFKGELHELVSDLSPQWIQDFIAELSQANTSSEYWDDGWLIVDVRQSGEIVAQKGLITRQLFPGEYINLDGIGAMPRVGGLVRLYFPRESTTFQPGFYFVFGERPDQRFHPQSVARYYFNLMPDGAAPFIKIATEQLNRFQIPFRLKCLNHPEVFAARLDSVVVFVNRRFHRIVSEIMLDVYRAVDKYIQPETPLCTYEIAPGLAFAEDPANGESFGISRCRIIAEGLWQAYTEGKHTSEARALAMKEQFTAYQLSFDKPYLNPQSPYEYNFPILGQQDGVWKQ